MAKSKIKSKLIRARIVCEFHCGHCDVDVVDDECDISSSSYEQYGQTVIEEWVSAQCPHCKNFVEFEDPSFC